MSKKPTFFWASYADLMTSLFFIMLVLFVLTVVMLKRKQEKIEIENVRLNNILKLEEQFKPLQNDNDFVFLSNCKKYISKDLMGVEIFEPNDIVIKKEYTQTTIKVGRKIESFLKSLSTKNSEFSYLLVIEGNMANKFDMSISKNSNWGYIKSYQRALAVYNLWQNGGIDFRKYNVEVMLCGSGFNGLCRDDVEENNKRFSIQIIPKVTVNQ